MSEGMKVAVYCRVGHSERRWQRGTDSNSDTAHY